MATPPRQGNHDAVEATNVDALFTKLSACRRGYITATMDPYLATLADSVLLKGGSASQKQKHQRQRDDFAPLIRLGTYARYACVRRALEAFLATSPTPQIISLGAGFDTLPFLACSANDGVTWVNVDLPETCLTLARAVASTQNLRDAVGLEPHEVDMKLPVPLRTKKYAVVCVDLAADGAPDALVVALTRGELPLLDTSRPTLLLSECCLAYLPAEQGDAIVSAVARAFPTVRILMYEMTLGGPFGEQMMTNLRLRGCPPVGAANSASALAERLRRCVNEAGDGGDGDDSWPPWSSSRSFDAVDMASAISRAMDAEDWRRVRTIEPLDEVEEFNLLQKHYALAWARRDGAAVV